MKPTPAKAGEAISSLSNYFAKKEGFLWILSYVIIRSKNQIKKQLGEISNVKNLFNQKKLAIAFFFKNNF